MQPNAKPYLETGRRRNVHSGFYTTWHLTLNCLCTWHNIADVPSKQSMKYSFRLESQEVRFFYFVPWSQCLRLVRLSVRSFFLSFFLSWFDLTLLCGRITEYNERLLRWSSPFVPVFHLGKETDFYKTQYWTLSTKICGATEFGFVWASSITLFLCKLKSKFLSTSKKRSSVQKN